MATPSEFGIEINVAASSPEKSSKVTINKAGTKLGIRPMGGMVQTFSAQASKSLCASSQGNVLSAPLVNSPQIYL
jgi:hypothetical protein